MFTDPVALSFKYKRNSTLPQREFVVATRRCAEGCLITLDGEPDILSVDVLVTVTAPDPVEATRVVYGHLTRNLLPGWHVHRMPGSVREVTYEWDGEYGYRAPVVKVCEAY